MPRDGSNVYSADWVNAAPNTTIESAKQNAMVADFVADANAARPITAGGTGETTARLKDGTWRFQNTADTTKLLAFDLSFIGSGATRTIFVPNTNVDLGLVGGVWRDLNTYSISNQAAVSITGIPAAAKVVEIYLDNVSPVTDSTNLQIRTSANGGSSYDSGASDYDYSQLRGVDSGAGGTITMAGAASQNSIIMTPVIGNATGEFVSGTITIHNPGLGSRTMLNYSLSGVNPSGQPFTSAGGGNRRSSAAVDAVQLTFLSGNLNTGKVTVRYFQ